MSEYREKMLLHNCKLLVDAVDRFAEEVDRGNLNYASEVLEEARAAIDWGRTHLKFMRPMQGFPYPIGDAIAYWRFQLPPGVKLQKPEAF